MAKTGEVTAQVKELQTALEKTEGERQKAVAHGVALRGETTEAMLKIKRLESKVALLTKERDCLTAILESYDEEEDVIASHQKQGNAVALLATPEKAKDVRMKELERTLAAAQQHAIDLEAAITRISEVANEHRRKCEVLAQELGDNHDKLKSLERENQRLRGELAVLGR